MARGPDCKLRHELIQTALQTEGVHQVQGGGRVGGAPAAHTRYGKKSGGTKTGCKAEEKDKELRLSK